SPLLCRRTCFLVLPLPRSSSDLLLPAVFSPWRRHLQSCGHSQVTTAHSRKVTCSLLVPVCSLGSSPVLCPQSLVISCTMSAVSGHLLYCVHSLWSSPVLCLQSLVISCTMSAVHWFRIFFFLFSSS
ncbi:unnamed protein product, partial [Staurois parvus]